MVKSATAASPLAMDIMTERHDITSRLQKALLNDEAVFGTLRKDGERPAIEMVSVHHLYKMVNNRPLVRPAWYFDTAVQGEGITDVTTHLVDLAQWMTATDRPVEYERDVELISARQWPTVVPRDVFEQITGLTAFPAAVQPHVKGGDLHYLCNGVVSYRLRGALVQLESVWALAIPPGGGDTHYCIARGTRADLVVDQGPDTQFLTRLSIHPADKSVAYKQALEHAIAILQLAFPGIGLVADGEIFRIAIPKDLRTTHEEHFAAVLEEFLTYIDEADAPENLGSDLVAKYTLLGRASELSRGC
jgi:predicted dehydrogenase